MSDMTVSDDERTDDEAAAKTDDTQVFDKAVQGDSHSIRVLLLALGFYAVIAAVGCVGRYFATKWAVKAAILESRS